jgi:zinc transporter ZupT
MVTRTDIHTTTKKSNCMSKLIFGGTLYLFRLFRPTHVSIEFAEPERCEINCERVREHPPIRMKSQPHAHSHGTRSVTIVLAIAFHAIIEGLALGVQVN